MSVPTPTSPDDNATERLEANAAPPARARLDAPLFAPPAVLAGRFRIERFIAAGGMGEVYEATDTELGQRVAVKVVRPELAADRTALERFRREALLARQVTHSSVCRIYDVFHHQETEGAGMDVTVLSMELLAGETLKERIRRDGKLTAEEALPIVRQIAGALGEAHEQGIVHRDLKSSNVVLVPGSRSASRDASSQAVQRSAVRRSGSMTQTGSRGERAVVTDFGLARLGSGAEQAKTVTAAGHILGTPAYMAPEQITGGEITPAADVYALGVLIYEMVTGRLPFEAESAVAVTFKRLHEDPTPPSTHVPDLDRNWVAAIDACLHRSPSQRPASAAEVVALLVGDEASPAVRSRKRTLAGLAAAALVVAGLGAGWAIGRRPADDAGRAQEEELRRAVAVLGFKDLVGRDETTWIGTALSEMLTMELAAGRELRTVSGGNVARTRLELGLDDVTSLTNDGLGEVGEHLGADLLISGSYFAGGGRIRLDLRLDAVDGVRQEVMITDEAAEDELLDLVSRTGERLRRELGVGTPQDDGVRAAALPRDPAAARLYAEGLEKLRLFDSLAARDLFAEAARLAPDSALVHMVLAEAWDRLGYKMKAAEAAARAYELRDGLALEERLLVEGRYHLSRYAWDEAVSTYETLADAYPDDLDYGLALADAQTEGRRGEDALATVERLRPLAASGTAAARLDIAEARAAYATGGNPRAREAANRAIVRARQAGARWLLAHALYHRANSERRMGLLDEAFAALDEAEPAFREMGDERAVADCLVVRDTLLADQGRFAEARQTIDEALAIFARIGDQRGYGRAANNLGVIAMSQGDVNGARKAYEEAIEVSRRSGDLRSLVYHLNNLAIAVKSQGELSAARELYEEALERARESGDRYIIAPPLANLGILHRQQGDLAIARRYYEEALALAVEMRDRRSEARRTSNLGSLAWELGDVEEARTLVRKALPALKDYPTSYASALTSLGDILVTCGELDEAQVAMDEALAIRREIRQHRGIASTLNSLADLALARGRPAEARTLAEESLAVLGGGNLLAEISVRHSLVLALFELGVSAEVLQAARPTDGGEDLALADGLRLEEMEALGLASEGRFAEARRVLENIVRTVSEKGMVRLGLRYRLTLGKVAHRAGDPDATAILAGVEKEAREIGFLLYAEQARALREP